MIREFIDKLENSNVEWYMFGSFIDRPFDADDIDMAIIMDNDKRDIIVGSVVKFREVVGRVQINGYTKSLRKNHKDVDLVLLSDVYEKQKFLNVSGALPSRECFSRGIITSNSLNAYQWR